MTLDTLDRMPLKRLPRHFETIASQHHLNQDHHACLTNTGSLLYTLNATLTEWADWTHLYPIPETPLPEALNTLKTFVERLAEHGHPALKTPLLKTGHVVRNDNSCQIHLTYTDAFQDTCNQAGITLRSILNVYPRRTPPKSVNLARGKPALLYPLYVNSQLLQLYEEALELTATPAAT